MCTQKQHDEISSLQAEIEEVIPLGIVIPGERESQRLARNIIRTFAANLSDGFSLEYCRDIAMSSLEEIVDMRVEALISRIS